MNRATITDSAEIEASSRLYLAMRYHDADRALELSAALRSGSYDIIADALDRIDLDNYHAGADVCQHVWPGV